MMSRGEDRGPELAPRDAGDGSSNPGSPSADRLPFRVTLSGEFLRDLVGFLPAIIFVLLFALLPLLYLLAQGSGAATGASGAIVVLSGQGTLGAVVRAGLEHSTLQGGVSAFLAFLWGYPVGAFLGRKFFRGRDTLLALLLVPFLLPILVVVLGVQEAFGASGPLAALGSGPRALGRGLPGILTVNLFYNVPIVALFTVAGLARSPRALEEAVATLGGGPWRVFCDVWARPSLLGASAGALLTFLFSFLSFAPPLILGGGSYANYTIEDWIYALFHLTASPGNSGLAGPVAFETVLLLLVPSLVYLGVARRLRLLGSSSSRGHPRVPLTFRDLPFLGATGLLLGLVLLVLGTIVASAFGLGTRAVGGENFTLLFSPRATATLSGTTTLTATFNTLFFASVATGIILLVCLSAGFARLRHPKVGFLVDALGFVPLLVSPVILALALWEFYPGTLYTAAWLWVLIIGAQASLALPFALQAVEAGLLSLPPAGREAAATLGARPWRAFLDIEVPRIRPAMLTAALFSFALGLGEFTATNFLYIPPYTTLPVELYVLEGAHFPAGVASALGALLILLSLVTFLLILGVGRRGER